MPLHHYLPATFLASFSSEDVIPRRESVLVVGDKRTGKIFRSSAGNVAAENNLYTLVDARNDNPQRIDNVWADYEKHLSEAVAQLVGRVVDGTTWARVLVPFVTCMFVRSPDFNQRFEARIEPLKTFVSADNTNEARMMELQRLLAPVVAAKWKVLRAQGTEPLIANDVGFAGFRDSESAEVGITIPLGRKHALAIIPMRRRAILSLSNGAWRPIIEYRTLATGNQSQFNLAAAHCARRFIFGPDEETVRRYLHLARDLGGTPEPLELGFIPGRLRMVHEFAWHRLVSYLEKSPDDEDCLTSDVLDWAAVARGWHPPAVIPLLWPFSLYTSTVRRQGSLVKVDLYDVRGFTDETPTSQGDIDSALQKVALERAELILRKAEEVTLRAAGLHRQGKLAEASRTYASALKLVQAIGARSFEAALLGVKGNVDARRGLLTSARAHFEQALAICRDTGDQRGEAEQLGNLGCLAFDEGDMALAEELQQQALQIHDGIRDRRGTAADLLNLSNARRGLSDSQGARELRERAIGIFRELGDKDGEAHTLGALANLYLEEGDLNVAEEYYRRSLAKYREAGDVLGEGHGMAQLGRLLNEKGDQRSALELLKSAVEIFDTAGAETAVAKAAREALQTMGGDCASRMSS